MREILDFKTPIRDGVPPAASYRKRSGVLRRVPRPVSPGLDTAGHNLFFFWVLVLLFRGHYS